MDVDSISNALIGNNDGSTPVSNAVVWFTASFGCTGTLIAPRIVLTAGHCISHNPPDPSLPYTNGNWEEPGRWYPLYDFPSGIAVQFGNDRSNFLFTARATQYNIAGFDDIMLVGLESPVPESIAKPAMVLTRIPENETPADFWQNKTFQMVGWGLTNANTLPQFRQIATAVFARYPYVSDGVLQPNMLHATGVAGSTTQFGDSGGPLFWKDPVTGVRQVIGVNQGPAFQGGRYVVTFGVGGADSQGQTHPNIRRWLENRLILQAEWRRVGRPALARRIAACFDGTIYALNQDKSLWLNQERGADSAWVKVRDELPNARSITCAAGLVYFQKENRELWYVSKSGELVRAGNPWGAAEVCGTEDTSLDFPFLWALNDDKTLWTNTNGGADNQWNQVGRPEEAKRIAATQDAVFALNMSGKFWMNKYGGRDDSWQFLGWAPEAIEIAAASLGQSDDVRLYALNKDYSLWEGTLVLGDVPQAA